MTTEDNAGNNTAKRTDTASFKCEGCGANMVFNPETQTLYCEHCGRTVSFDKKAARELDISQGFSKDRLWEKGSVSLFRCGNCGAELVLSGGEVAKVCPFCGTAHVEKTEELAGLKPNALLEFTFKPEKAAEKAAAWAKRKFFAPRKFKRNISTENLRGVYMPSFTFDSSTTSVYEGKIGIEHTRTVGSGKNAHTVVEVEWRYISGTVFNDFDDVLITASDRLDQKKLNKISPFDTNSSKLYDEKFVSGYVMYRYDNELTDCWSAAKATMDGYIRRDILSRYHYDRLAYLNVSTTHERVTYKYVMLPVYVGNFRYANKTYNFFVNGSNGKVYGKTPKSALKIAGVILLGAAALGLLFWFLSRK